MNTVIKHNDIIFFYTYLIIFFLLLIKKVYACCITLIFFIIFFLSFISVTKSVKILFVLFLCLLFSSCAARIEYVEKTSETMSRTVYALDESLRFGRYDLSDMYSANLLKLVPPPEKPIRITPIYDNN